MAELYRYAAFVSYSSKDAAFAKRLHQALEGYGIPTALGKFDLLGGGGKPNRIYPVFRDRDELSAGALSENLEAALKASGALIVVCSPAAAASPWVNKEIEFFLQLGRRDRIFAIITNDSPATLDGRDATSATFPPAFRGDGLVADGFEPIAADARSGKDGFRAAWLKIVAGLVGVSPGALIDRDRRRRQQQRTRLAAMAVAAWLAVVAVLVSASTFAWREGLTAKSAALLSSGDTISALPFALAGVNLGGTLVPFHSGRGDEVLTDLGSARLARDLGMLRDRKLSEDGRILFAAAPDWTGFFCDMTAGCVPTSLGKMARYQSVRFAGDGSKLVSINEDDTATLYDLAHGGQSRQLGKLGDFSDAKLSADGRALIVLERNGKGAYFDLASGTSPIDLGNVGDLQDFELSQDGATLATRTTAGDVTLYDLAAGGTPRRLGSFGAFGDSSAQRFLANGRALVLRAADGTAVRYGLLRGGGTQAVGNLGDVFDWDLSADGRMLVVIAKDGAIRSYDLASNPGPQALGVVKQMLDRQFSPDGRVWSTRALVKPFVPPPLGQDQPKGALDDTVTLYDLSAGGAEQSLGKFGPVRDYIFGIDGHTLVIRSLDSTTTIYHPFDAVPSKRIGAYLGLMMTTDRKSLLVVDKDGTAFVFPLDGAERRNFGKSFSMDWDDGALNLSADGSTAMHILPGGRATLYDLTAPAPRQAGAGLAADVCRMSGDAIRPFMSRLRDPVADKDRSADSDRAIYATLRGRPWHPCDWRGLAAGPEGWAQFWRMIRIRYLGAPDYTCEERTAAGTRDAVSVVRCARLREVEAAMSLDNL